MLLNESALAWPLLPTGAPDPVDPGKWSSAKALAVEWLWGASGRQFGTRTATYRPATSQLTSSYYDDVNYLQSVYGPLWGDGWPFVGDPRDSDLARRKVLELPAPALAIATVQLVDDTGTITVLDGMSGGWRLDGNYLVRTDGGTWPSSQDMTATDGQPNTWHVQYTRGVAVPAAGQVAAGQLAAEWYKLVVGDSTCKLPYNTTTVTRAGVTVQRDVSKALVTTGLPLVDRWVALVNPAGLAQPPRLWSPDVRRNQGPYIGAGVPYRAG